MMMLHLLLPANAKSGIFNMKCYYQHFCLS